MPPFALPAMKENKGIPKIRTQTETRNSGQFSITEFTYRAQRLQGHLSVNLISLHISLNCIRIKFFKWSNNTIQTQRFASNK